MPLYEYICNDCHTVFEQFRKYNSTTEPFCEFCGSYNVALKPSISTAILKGQGWERDGYTTSAGE